MNENELDKVHRLEVELAELKVEQRCSAEARDHQADEYARRLMELNHAHQQQIERNANYVGREIFESRFSVHEIRISALEKWMWAGIGAAGIVGGGVGWMLSHLIKP